MRISRFVATAAALLTAGSALATGSLSGVASAHGNTGNRLPAHVFAPYFQSYQDGVSPAALSKASGAKYLTMAFLETAGGGSCTPLWNNEPTEPVAWSTYGPDIAKIRARGGDVVPSFGGFSADDEARELADSCTSVDKIAAAYEKRRHDVQRDASRHGRRGQLTEQPARHRSPQQGHRQGRGVGGRTSPHRAVRLHRADRLERHRERRRAHPAQRGAEPRAHRRRQHHDVRLLRQRIARDGSGHEDRGHRAWSRSCTRCTRRGRPASCGRRSASPR